MHTQKAQCVSFMPHWPCRQRKRSEAACKGQGVGGTACVWGQMGKAAGGEEGGKCGVSMGKSLSRSTAGNGQRVGRQFKRGRCV